MVNEETAAKMIRIGAQAGEKFVSKLYFASAQLAPSERMSPVGEDVEMLQDLILAAVNDALTKSQEMVAAQMSKLTGGLNLPGLI